MSTPLRIVVTGANRGLGLEFVRRYVGAGHAVLGTARDVDAADDLRAFAADHADRCTVAPCDVTDQASVEALVGQLPWEHVDLLINNAGASGGTDETLEAVDFAVLLAAFAVNAVGPLRLTRALLPRLADNAKVVHISSLMGSISDNTSGGRYGYRMSKAALNMAVRCLGHDLARRGLVTFAMHPGWVRTDMGGAAAPLGIEESVEAMITSIESRTPAHDGLFFDQNGDPLPW